MKPIQNSRSGLTVQANNIKIGMNILIWIMYLNRKKLSKE